MDPLTKSYPWYTPYQFAGNMPIAFIDLDGLEPLSYLKKMPHIGDSDPSAFVHNSLVSGINSVIRLVNFVDVALKDPDALPQGNEILWSIDEGIQDFIKYRRWEETGTKEDMLGNILLGAASKTLLKGIPKKVPINKFDNIRVQKSGIWKKITDLPIQSHHLLTKYGEWGKRFKRVLKKYDLDIDGDFNKLDMHHQGPHPPEYHQEMNRRLIKIDEAAAGDKDTFLELFEKKIKNYVNDNPEVIHHNVEIIE